MHSIHTHTHSLCETLYVLKARRICAIDEESSYEAIPDVRNECLQQQPS